jgi:hypothetical protein
MLRKAAPASSMEKAYNDAYLSCSTAIYFEGQVGNYAGKQTEGVPLLTRMGNRIMRPKPFARGEMRWTRSTTTMPTRCRPVMCRGQRRRKRCRTH